MNDIVIQRGLKPKRKMALMLFSVTLMDAEGQIVGQLQKVHIVTPRAGGRAFENANIDVETTNEYVIARFEIPTK